MAKVGFDNDTTKYCSQLVCPSSSKNFVCSKLTIETLEKGVKYSLSCNDAALVPLLITFSHLFSVSIVDFEDVFVYENNYENKISTPIPSKIYLIKIICQFYFAIFL